MTPSRIVVVDDHALILSGTVTSLEGQYPDAELLTAQTAAEAMQHVSHSQPDLMMMDLSIPQTSEDKADADTGLQLLRQLMQEYPTLNIVVQTAFPQALIRLKPTINNHEGGFAIASKDLATQVMLQRVEWALQGMMFTSKEMRTGLEFKPEWLEVLTLAFKDGLQDRAISERMHLSERTVRNYWTRVQDALAVYPEAGKNIRIQTEIRAREEGLID